MDTSSTPEQKGGRPPGACDRIHRPGVRVINRALKEIAARAAEGSELDQQLLVAMQVVEAVRPMDLRGQHNGLGFTGGGLLG